MPLRHSSIACAVMLASAALWAGPAYAAAPRPLPCTDIIVNVGQSNSFWGYGPFNAPLHDRDQLIMQVGRFGADNMQIVPTGIRANGNKYDGLQYVTRENALTTTFSWVYQFARHYVYYRLQAGCKVVIVPAAVGGTSIREWNSELNNGHGDLFRNLLDMTWQAYRQPGNNKIVAVVISDGEIDAHGCEGGSGVYNTTPALFRGGLTKFFQRVRLKLPTRDTYPIIMLGGFPEDWHFAKPACKTATEAAIGQAISSEQFAGIVSPRGLASVPSTPKHFDGVAHVELGNRFFTEYVRLVAH
jgi:hypothetical protein